MGSEVSLIKQRTDKRIEIKNALYMSIIWPVSGGFSRQTNNVSAISLTVGDIIMNIFLSFCGN